MTTVQERINDGLRWLETFGQGDKPPSRVERLEAELKAWEGRSTLARREAASRRKELDAFWRGIDNLTLSDITEEAAKLSRLETEVSIFDGLAARAYQHAEMVRFDLAGAYTTGDEYAALKARAGEIQVILSELTGRTHLTNAQDMTINTLLRELGDIRRKMSEKYGYREWMSEKLSEGRMEAQEISKTGREIDPRFS